MAWFGKAKSTERKDLIIGRIEGDHQNIGSGIAVFFLVLGFIVMVVAMFAEGSAVRLAAWGAIWTGWNVLCAIPIITSGLTVNYVIYRETPPPAA